VSESKSQAKPFEISKRVVWEAYLRVKANKGVAGVDGQTIEQYEQDLKNNLFKLWNRLSSGSYFPPPVKAVAIPKAGGGSRILGVPTVDDRIAQTVAAMYLEREVEPIFHPDSYGYRLGRSALDAVGRCRERCWRNDWVIDLDVRAFFDSVDHSLMLRAVERHTDQRWILLYVTRWLQAQLRQPDGTLTARDRGTPQGSLCEASHNPPYGQRWVMRSARGCRWWGRWRRSGAAHKLGRILITWLGCDGGCVRTGVWLGC
jgi:group II intron reverse transcriptase/maturase